MAVYEGSENYIFVSYAHKDSKVVVPIIDALQNAGFRVWYDQGIQAGTEWPEYIEDHLNNCKCVLVCMSPATIDSINCRNEINYACMLKKDLLIVYLEETVLAKGMNLQLNSQQSLFKYRHSENETFLSEVLKANILQSCLTGSNSNSQNKTTPPSTTPKKNPANDPTNRLETISRRLNGRHEISRVGSMGSNTPSNPWPRGDYSQAISTNKFSVVHFHCNLIRPCVKDGTRTVGLRIYDQNDNLVFESVTNIPLVTGNDKISLGWVIKDSMGLPQTPGTYCAVIWIDDSRAFEYTFQLFAENQAVQGGSDNDAEIESLTKKLQYPKLFVLNLLTNIFFIIALACTSSNSVPAFLIFLIICFVFATITCKKTKQIVTNKKFLPFLFVFIVGFHFGMYLLVMTIICSVNRKKWTDRLNTLQANRNL